MVIIICQTVTIVNFFFFIFFSIYYHHHQQYGCLFCFQRYNKQTNKLMRIYFFFTIINNIFTIDNFVVFFKPKIFMTFVSFFTLFVQILLIDYHWWSNAENFGKKHFFFDQKQILLIDLIWNQFIATTTTTLLTQKENPKDVFKKLAWINNWFSFCSINKIFSEKPWKLLIFKRNEKWNENENHLQKKKTGLRHFFWAKELKIFVFVFFLIIRLPPDWNNHSDDRLMMSAVKNFLFWKIFLFPIKK